MHGSGRASDIHSILGNFELIIEDSTHQRKDIPLSSERIDPENIGVLGDDDEISLNSPDDIKSISTTQKVESSIASSIFNLSNCIIGSGVLALPYAFKLSGMGLGLIFLAIIAVTAMYTYDVLVRSSEYTGAKSYRGVATELFSRKIGYFCEIVVALFTICGLSSYPLIIGDYATSIVNEFVSTPGWYSSRAFLLITIAILVFLPLSLAKTIDFLKFSSLFAIICVVMCVCIVIMYLFRAIDGSVPFGEGEIVWVERGIGVVRAIPLMSMSYTSHFLILNIYSELSERSVPRMRKVLVNSAIIVTSMYLTMSVAGYSTFRQSTNSNVLNSFPDSDVSAMIGKVGLLITLSRQEYLGQQKE
ncbi:translocase, putative [Aduncisulcus paluster]|uniref:Translocase, putative n=1 Tax=Aduncisulcus paluster TaxID=2918883 RepID=A0ABQ5KTH4_9EUKA|nr:translocase, putative [Aduncisulcus paluster]